MKQLKTSHLSYFRDRFISLCRRTLGLKTSLGVFALIVMLPNSAWSSFDAEVGVEARYFFEEGFAQQEKFHPSIRADVEYSLDIAGGEFVSKVFGRYDAEDDERTHADLREALWTYFGDEWELKLGLGKVFWGVTESRHLVDIINQTDAVENPDGEDKLGQPMVKVSFEKEWGTLDMFWLPYFRERTYPGLDGRLLVSPFEIDRDNPMYESDAKRWRSDFAVRYSHYIGDLEFAVSHFSGTSREARFMLGGTPFAPTLRPYYSVVDQTGLELQYIYEEWLLKLEAITNAGFGSLSDSRQRYSAAVAGFEYTQVGVFDSSADLGWIVEYLFDDRKEESTHFFERDVFAGWRYALNDEDSSEVLTGFIYDPKTEECMFSFEANKRLASDLKLYFEARVFNGADSDASLKTYMLKDEDYVQFELVKYF